MLTTEGGEHRAAKHLVVLLRRLALGGAAGPGAATGGPQVAARATEAASALGALRRLQVCWLGCRRCRRCWCRLRGMATVL